MEGKSSPHFLTCERRMVFELLMLAAGMMGAYTYNLRGGVFCNAQTANLLMIAIAVGDRRWKTALYYLVPATAYLMGAVLSEALPKPVKRMRLLRWDTYLIGFEILVLVGCGFIPLTVSHHVVQVMINFICSMQYNTFRQAEGIPMATTFCTNHLRQIGVWLVKYVKKGEKKSRVRASRHVLMLVMFIAGGAVETVACGIMNEKAIWLAAVPLVVNLCMLVYADLTVEKEKLDKVPLGH